MSNKTIVGFVCVCWLEHYFCSEGKPLWVALGPAMWCSRNVLSKSTIKQWSSQQKGGVGWGGEQDKKVRSIGSSQYWNLCWPSIWLFHLSLQRQGPRGSEMPWDISLRRFLSKHKPELCSAWNPASQIMWEQRLQFELCKNGVRGSTSQLKSGGVGPSKCEARNQSDCIGQIAPRTAQIPIAETLEFWSSSQHNIATLLYDVYMQAFVLIGKQWTWKVCLQMFLTSPRWGDVP